MDEGRDMGVIRGGDGTEESDLEISSEFSSGESSDGDDRVQDAGGTPAGNTVALMALLLMVI